jgi:hypothetical protein
VPPRLNRGDNSPSASCPARIVAAAKYSVNFLLATHFRSRMAQPLLQECILPRLQEIKVLESGELEERRQATRRSHLRARRLQRNLVTHIRFSDYALEKSGIFGFRTGAFWKLNELGLTFGLD